MKEPLEALDPALYRETVRRALAEDLGWGDVTSDAIVGENQRAVGVLIVKRPCVLAGLDVAAECFRQLDPSAAFDAHRRDADVCRSGDIVAEVRGFAAALLTAERTALNFLQRLSGIATLTRRYVETVAGRIIVLDTRKTTPTLRVLEKYAVRAGGGVNHRAALDGGILIKENHSRLAGGIGEAIRRMKAAPTDLPIEVEAQSLAEVDEALAAGAHIVLVDNLPLEEAAEAVRRCRGRAKTEISGGVSLEQMPAIAATGADFVSIGALTHSAAAIDISFEIQPLG